MFQYSIKINKSILVLKKKEKSECTDKKKKELDIKKI